MLIAAPATTRAHERKTVGAVHMVIGWRDEPVFSGSRNAVEVRVLDGAGAPVTDPDASLSVEIAFGDERLTLPLVAGREPGTFAAWLLPNRPGTYAFHIKGTFKGQPIDTTSTCSEQTFDCVTDASAIQFPAKDPAVGELADRLTRGLPRAERAGDEAVRARTLAIAALAMASFALVGVAGVALKKGRSRA